MEDKDLIMAVKYIPRCSQGILEERFMTDVGYEWFTATKYTNAEILKEWEAGTISLNIPLDRFKIIRSRYYGV
jgi:hypothetical protein